MLMNSGPCLVKPKAYNESQPQAQPNQDQIGDNLQNALMAARKIQQKITQQRAVLINRAWCILKYA